MPSVSLVRLALILTALCVGGAACGDEDEDTADATTEREGPEGCYIPGNMLCDCDLDEAGCTEDVGVWTTGCDTCAD
jgi:hypothetical protein